MGERSLKMMIGRRIAEVRESEKFTQLDLAEALDVTKGTVSRWENGERPPTTERLDDIAGVLGVDPVLLVTLDSEDYRRAMDEAATIVEGKLSDLVEALRERAEPPGDELPPTVPGSDGAKGRAG